jgi:hypothetical protein
MTISGTETIRLTESNGQLSGTGNIELTMSGMGSDMYATGTETLTGTVSADRTAHLTITRAFAQATVNVGGQSITVPASEVDVPLDTPYEIKLQDGFTQTYSIQDFGLVTLTVRSGGDSGQHKVTFTQTGVPAGTVWWVKASGTNKTTTSSSITFDLNDGTYAYQAGIACPASPEDFPIQLTQIRTTSSGAAPTTQATIDDIIFVDGIATKPDSIGWYRFTHNSGTVAVSGQDSTVQLSASEANVVEEDTIKLQYSCPNGPDFVLGAAASYEGSFYASLGASTFGELFPAMLINHTGNWHVKAVAEVTLSTLDDEVTFTTESNTLDFYVDFAGPTTTLTVSVNGVDNALSFYTTTNGATASDPAYAKSGDGYDVSFQLTGPTGNSSTITMVIPKTAVPAGFVPQTKINGVLVEQQYTEDSTYYYVSFEAHFSTDQVVIHFSPQTQGTPTPTALASTSPSAESTYDQILAYIEASGIKDKSLADVKAQTWIFNNQYDGVDIYQPDQYPARYYARALDIYLLDTDWYSYEMYVFDSNTHLVGVAIAVTYSDQNRNYIAVFDPLTYNDVFSTYDGNGDNSLTYYKISDKVEIGKNLWINFATGYNYDNLDKDGTYLIVLDNSLLQSGGEPTEAPTKNQSNTDNTMLYIGIIAVALVVGAVGGIVSLKRKKKPQQYPVAPTSAYQPPPSTAYPPPPQPPAADRFQGSNSYGNSIPVRKFCPNCGNALSAGNSSKFCPYCGKTLETQ